MKNFHTTEQILLTWERAWKAGINTFVTNSETKHVIETTQKYLAEGGPMSWIAQVGRSDDMKAHIDYVCEIGCKALFLHGGLMDNLFQEKDEATLRSWIGHAKTKGLPVGVAAHNIAAHEWMYQLGVADFHVVPFFNCGSLHNAGGGEHFWLEDVTRAVNFIQSISKPCIAYKVLGAGRIEAKMGLGYAYRNIKPGDVVNLGMNRADNDNIVEEDVQLVAELLKTP
ncbi:MAG: hypothetical protein IJJ26_11465 [Victivallales bacterium]|nr:hypothetical protein [Victivallales bacterium]